MQKFVLELTIKNLYMLVKMNLFPNLKGSWFSEKKKEQISDVFISTWDQQSKIKVEGKFYKF